METMSPEEEDLVSMNPLVPQRAAEEEGAFKIPPLVPQGDDEEASQLLLEAVQHVGILLPVRVLQPERTMGTRKAQDL